MQGRRPAEIPYSVTVSPVSLLILRGEVLEVRNIDGRLHVARKERHRDEWDPPVPVYDRCWPGNETLGVLHLGRFHFQGRAAHV
jgi:hypothetical protein